MRPRIVAPFVALLLVSACALETARPAAPAPSSDPPSTTATATPSASGQDTRPALAETRSTKTPELKVEVVGLNRVKASTW
ncbi:hypothetical protein [Nonomuraea turkmeniaca]|uniref:hypothetical protein n=1 Tax=Nonomuraea turkmeniaca TaxID=103838 RepID=UPI00147750F9|nr:hypothetical protein [Nonomuraea turkmeniaca]